MSFFNLSTGEAVKSNGEAEVTNNDPIPDGTVLRVMITEAKWKDANEFNPRHIALRWDVIDGEYKKRMVFHKVQVAHDDTNKRDKAIKMLAAIDANAGGKLMAAGTEPSDMDLMMNLCNKPMQIKVGVWDMNDRKGNWVMAVSSGKAPAEQPATQAPTVTTEQAAAQDKANDNAISF